MKVKKLASLGLLTALALIIYTVELLLPELAPVPGMKLGLANIVTVFAVYRFSAKETALVLYARIILGTIFGGNLSALIFSLSGGTFCLIGMLLLKKVIDKKHIWLSGVFGAVLHNTGQMTAAVLVMKTTAVIVYMPFLLVTGCIAGLFTGLTAQLLIKRLSENGDL